jgi:hypothetical protein
MSQQLSEEELYQRAKKIVEEKKGFYTHFAVYVCVNTLLIVIWAVTGAGFPWFIFPLAGWGIGVLFHFLGIFVFNKETGWEKRQIEKEMERMRHSRN